MAEGDYRPRLSVDVTEEQFNELTLFLPKGLRKQVMSTLVQELIMLLKRLTSSQRERFYGAIISGQIKFEEVLPTMEDADGYD